MEGRRQRKLVKYAEDGSEDDDDDEPGGKRRKGAHRGWPQGLQEGRGGGCHAGVARNTLQMGLGEGKGGRKPVELQ